jgi:predicted RNase H-like HicB family nuclease
LGLAIVAGLVVLFWNEYRTDRMLFHVTLTPAEDGWIVAECPALPECVSQGQDEKEALEDIKEAIIAWLWAEDQKAVKSLPETLGNPPIVAAV